MPRLTKAQMRDNFGMEAHRGRARFSVPPQGINYLDGNGKVFYLDPVSGSNSYDGEAPTKAKLTLAGALAACTSGRGDVIVCMPGTETSTVTTTISKAGVTIIGSNYGAATPNYLLTTAATTFNTLTVAAACNIVGIAVQGAYATGSAVHVAANDVKIDGCEFVKDDTLYGVLLYGAQSCHIKDNLFFGFSDATDVGLRLDDNVATTVPTGAVIEGNTFMSCTNGVDVVVDVVWGYSHGNTFILSTDDPYQFQVASQTTGFFIFNDTYDETDANAVTSYTTNLLAAAGNVFVSGGRYDENTVTDEEVALASRTFYVDGTNGLAGNDGFTIDTAKATIAQAYALCTTLRGDIIRILPGTYEQAAVLAAAKAGITYIAHDYGGRFPVVIANAAAYTTAESVLVTEPCKFVGITFTSLDTDGPAVRLEYDSTDAPNADGVVFENCVFGTDTNDHGLTLQGAQNTLIQDCTFTTLTIGLRTLSGTGTDTNDVSGTKVVGGVFQACSTAIHLSEDAVSTIIDGCSFDGCTAGINTGLITQTTMLVVQNTNSGFASADALIDYADAAARATAKCFCSGNLFLNETTGNRTFYVDGTNGAAGNDGRTIDTAKATIAQAMALCTTLNGDTIKILPGTYAQAETLTVAKAGITFKAFDGYGEGLSSAPVVISAAGGYTTAEAVTVSAPAVFEGITFSSKFATGAAVVVMYDSTDGEDGDGVVFKNCRFIADTNINGLTLEGAQNTEIVGCTLVSLTSGLNTLSSVGTGTDDVSGVQVKDCDFIACTTAIDIAEQAVVVVIEGCKIIGCTAGIENNDVVFTVGLIATNNYTDLANDAALFTSQANAAERATDNIFSAGNYFLAGD